MSKPSYEDLPRDPEKNPPESLEELELLITQLQEKAVSIKHQLEVAALDEKRGVDVDYDRMRRAIYAKSRTNRSIAALQRIAKQRRQQIAAKSDMSFETCFFAAAKDCLSAETFAQVITRANSILRKAETAPQTVGQ